MFTVAVKIDRSVAIVWEYFTKIDNWNKWYGGAVKEIVPAWQTGAKIVWSLGGASEVAGYIAGREICLSGAWMDTTYRFRPEGDTAAIVEIIESDPKGGASFSDGGTAHKAQIETTLRNLKECIERETGATPGGGAVAAAAPVPQVDQDYRQALKEGTVLCAFILEAPVTENSDMKVFDIPEASQELTTWIQTLINLPDASVAIFSPQEWEQPRLKSITAQELNASINKDALASMQKSMVKRGLPDLYPVELAQHLVAVPANPQRGRVLLIFRISQSTPLFNLPTRGLYVAFAGDSSRLAVGDFMGGKVYLWDMQEAVIGTFKGAELAFSPDGAMLATYLARPGEGIQLWRMSDQSLVRTLARQSAGELHPKFSPDGSLLATTDGSSITLWRVADGTVLRTLAGHANEVLSIAFSPDGQILASGSRDLTARLWSVNEGKLLKTLTGHTSIVSSVTFTPDGSLLASAGHGDQTFRLWRVSDGELLLANKTDHKLIMSLAISPDGQTLATVGDRVIRLWRLSDAALLKAISTEDVMVTGVVFSPDGKRLATSSATGGMVRLWGCWF